MSVSYTHLEEAKAGVKEIMEDKKFGTAGNTMVVEEFMTGREAVSYTHLDVYKRQDLM